MLSNKFFFIERTCRNMQETLNFRPEMDSYPNDFRIVHIYNQSSTYHLTRQVLLDSALTQDTFTFFYHILAMDISDFNEKYGSFAYIIERNISEADLYLNVNRDALHHIVNFIQTNKIAKMIDANMVEEIIDLATIFAMPNLVEYCNSSHLL